MSRSNPQLTNPAEHFFEWRGGKGMLTWYDKEKQENIPVRMPFEFLVLDELSTITGYSKQNESGFWANEVRNVQNDEMYVRTKKGPFEAGLYGNLAQTRAKGGKYAKSIYIAHKIGDNWVMGNFKASGSALSAWIEFTKTLSRGLLETGKVVMKRGKAQDAPTGQFFAPEFEWVESTEEEDAIAKELDQELQIYLSKYLSAPKVDEDGRGIEEPAHATTEQLADFDKRKAAAGWSDKMSPADEKSTDVVIEDIDDEPINLDDIPF